MLAGVRFGQLGFGDALADKNWSYNNLWGVYAAQEKLIDQFAYANKMGFNIIYDSIRPTFDANGNLTLDNSGKNSDIWPIYDPNKLNRITVYKQQIAKYGFKFICEIEWPEPINSKNMQTYYNFFIKLITDTNYSWIQNWQISDTPEDLIYDPSTGTNIPKISPADYVTFLNKIRTSAKLISSNFKIGGPGIYKSLATLDPTNYLYSDTSFYHNWLSEAIQEGLLFNIDFFSIQLRQETEGMTYEKVAPLMELMKNLMDQYLDISIPIYSINQGRQELNKNSLASLKNQAYYNISEMLNTAKNGVTPILNCMVDPCDNTFLDPLYSASEDGYGIFRYDMSAKPEYDTLKFILNGLKDYTILTKPSKIYNNDKADNISFLSKNKDEIISIVWSKYKLQQTIILLPNINEYYQMQDGEPTQIINSVEWETSTDFIILLQHLDLSTTDFEDIKNKLFKQFMYNIHFRNSLLDSVPDGYNKTSDEMNFYKILRAFALEFADAEIQIDTLKDNMYLNTAHEDAIHQNFGTLVDLEKQADWDYEQYRVFVQSVIKSLLVGPTKASIEDAMNTFVNYNSIYNNGMRIADIKLHELYNDKTLDPSVYGGVYPQFAFVVEVNKSIDVDVDQNTLNRDLKYLVNILRPAHTLTFVVIILTGTENYKDWYYDTHIGPDGLNINFKDSDQVTMEMNPVGSRGKAEGTYGWKHKNYVGQFYTFDPNKVHNTKSNGGIYIGPRYLLNDSNHEELTMESVENINSIENIEDFEASVIRYGYYSDDQDSDREGSNGMVIDPKKDSPIPYNPTHLDPDYYNPDHGEYYKNWWLKTHKLKKYDPNDPSETYDKYDKDGNLKIKGNRFDIENREILVIRSDSNTGVEFLNTDVKLENKPYSVKKSYFVTYPLLFTTNKSLLPDEEVEPKHNVNYNVENSTGQLGGVKEFEVMDYVDSQINFAQQPFFFETNATTLINNDKNNSKFMGSSTYKKKTIFPEVNSYDKNIRINSKKNDLELGNLPYNEINQRPYRYDEHLANGDFHFEDMDQYNMATQIDENKFKQSQFIFTTNLNILPVSTHPNKLVNNLGMINSVEESLYMNMYKLLAPMFKLNMNLLADSLPALPNGAIRPIAMSYYVKDKDLTDKELAELDVERLEINPMIRIL